MLLVTALFGGLMLMSIQSRRRTIAILLIGAIAILATSPPPAQAQLPFCLPCVIQAVLATITVTIGGWLNQINGVLAKIFALFQQNNLVYRNRSLFPFDDAGRQSGDYKLMHLKVCRFN